jgi:hypothetical protein
MRGLSMAVILAAATLAGGAGAAPQDPMARLEAALDALPAVASWPLRDAFVKDMTAKHGPVPPDLVLVPVAEVYRGDRAVLFIVVAKGGRPDTGVIHLRRAGAGWTTLDEDAPHGWPHVEETVFRGPGETRVVRRAGLPLDQLPLYLRYLRRDLRQRLQAAAEAGDWKKWVSLMERGMGGVGLRGLEDTIRTFEDRPAEIDDVRLVRQEPMGDRVLGHFDLVSGGNMARETYVLAREGGGWVIDERYVPPVERTVASLRTIMVTLYLYSNDNGGLFPAVRDDAGLQPMLVPKYARELPASDAWGTPFRYVPGPDARSYTLVSAGADKTFRPDTWSLAGTYTDPAEDIVVDTSSFLREWQPPR